MYRVLFTPESRQDLQELYAFIAERSSKRVAQLYLGRLRAFCLGLAQAPHRGQPRPGLPPKVRSIGFERRASIVFEVVEPAQLILVVGILYGGRLPAALPAPLDRD